MQEQAERKLEQAERKLNHLNDLTMLLNHLAEAHERQTQTLAACQRAQTALQTAFEVVCMQL